MSKTLYLKFPGMHAFLVISVLCVHLNRKVYLSNNNLGGLSNKYCSLDICPLEGSKHKAVDNMKNAKSTEDADVPSGIPKRQNMNCTAFVSK